MNRYFPALDVLRLAAATLVMLGHVELILNYRWMEGFMPDSLLYETGKAGVGIFFALSGFLLAKILAEAKDAGEQAGWKVFLRNRALRILPLYYFVLAIAFVTSPAMNMFYIENSTEEMRAFFFEKLTLHLLLLPQLNDVFFDQHVPTAIQFWTIGSEVIFYLVLPLIMQHKKPLKVMVVVFAVFALTKFSLQMLYGKTDFDNCIGTLHQLMFLNRIDCMLIGSIAALLLHQKQKWAMTLSSKDNMIFGTGLVVIMLVMHRRVINGFDYALYAAAIIPYLMYFTLPERKPASGLWLKVLAHGGKISYSIYLIHFMVLMAVWYLLYEYTTFSDNEFVLLFYVLGIAAVYLVSAVTYRFVELPFLNMKKKQGE